MKKLFIILSISTLTCLMSCKNTDTNKRSSDEPHPDSTCNNINHCLISSGFDFKNVRTVIFRTYKKGTDFKVFIKEYKSVMDRDFLAQQQPDSWENKRKQRNIDIPKEINADVDFILLTTDSLEYRISDIKSDWEQFYGHDYLGWGCDMISWKVNGVEDNSGNIHIYKPGYVHPK